MNAGQVIQLFSRLTECNSTKELSGKMQQIIQEEFEHSAMRVYEMIPARVMHDDRLGKVVYRDTESFKVFGRVEDNQNYLAAFASKEPNTTVHDDGTTETVIPVVLSDRNISHVISIQHARKPNKTTESLDKIMVAFASLYKTLHEKNYDPLTRVLNRQAFEETCLDLEHAGSRPGANFITPFGVIAIIDIDFFKEINDQFGHAIGDEVLVLFCQLVMSITRDEDKFFRIGGEEFVLLLRLRDYAHAHRILERYRKVIDSKKFPQVNDLSASIGFANLNSSSHPMTQLAKADRALYYAKENGRNRVCGYAELLEKGLIEEVKEASPESEFWVK